jgi:hypothetical protein
MNQKAPRRLHGRASAVWRFRFQNIASAKIEVNEPGQRIVTVFTPLSTLMASPDSALAEISQRREKLFPVSPRRGLDSNVDEPRHGINGSSISR